MVRVEIDRACLTSSRVLSLCCVIFSRKFLVWHQLNVCVLPLINVSVTVACIAFVDEDCRVCCVMSGNAYVYCIQLVVQTLSDTTFFTVFVIFVVSWPVASRQIPVEFYVDYTDEWLALEGVNQSRAACDRANDLKSSVHRVGRCVVCSLRRS